MTNLVREHDRKTALLYTASHEVRGSVHGILGLVERLRESGDSISHSELLDALRDACSGLRSTVQQVLDVAQLEAGTPGGGEGVFDLRSLLREVTAVVQGGATASVTVAVAIDETCEPLRFGNAGRVNQILTNVAINGAKAMEQGVLSIEVRSIGEDTVRFVVRDQGAGMPTLAQDRLTGSEASRRRRSTDNAHFHEGAADPVAAPALTVRGGTDPAMLRRGSGLGLLIARELVELLHGRVEVSVQWGRGTVVLVDLPLPPMHRGWVPPPEPEADAVIARALIVDDAPDGLEFLINAIHPLAEHVDATVDPAEALELAAAARYDLVIVDGLMSPHDGADLARAMRRMATTHEAVIIVATGNVETVSASRYLFAGADLVLVKPFSRVELLRAIRRASTQRSAAGRPHEVIDLGEPEVIPAPALSLFSSLLEDRLHAIAEAYRRGDEDGFGRAVHALGSSAVMLGFDGLGRSCLALETVSHSLGLGAVGVNALDQLRSLAYASGPNLVATT